MNQEIDAKKIKEQLVRITENRLFNKSPRYVNLISFLVEESLKGNNLKEDVIGTEVFHDNYTAAKNDGLVRVYMYNLRKKLNTYYSDEGKLDDIKFVLNKGSYKIGFIENKGIKEPITNERSIKKQINKKSLALILTIIVATAAITYYYTTKEKLYLWESFFTKDVSNVCVLADQVVLSKKGGNPGEFLIHGEINSSEDFISYIKKNDIDTLQKKGYTYFTKSITHSIYNLSRWFFQHNAEFLRISESEFRYEETKRNNIVYIGQHKTMSVSKEVFLRDSKVFQVEANDNRTHLATHFTTIKEGQKKHYRARFNNSISSEYAMVSFMPLNENNKALYFVSNNDIGTMAVVDSFIDPDFLEQFYKKMPSPDSYFNALFKVEGIGRTDVNCELVELEVMER
ncbi:hypothetical protein [Labilibacter marinus]|uniref:hypothetical protein n=1 Tax=Labilibacter marinus TaxID=1477105 RepID=UPI000835BD41|nr:hypothetical protein [Labilibacter marinus]